MPVRPRGPQRGWYPTAPRQVGILKDLITRYRQHNREGTLPRGGRGIFYDLRPNGMGNGVTYRKPDSAHPISGFGPMEAHPAAVQEVLVMARRARADPRGMGRRHPCSRADPAELGRLSRQRGGQHRLLGRERRPAFQDGPAGRPGAVHRDVVRGSGTAGPMPKPKLPPVECDEHGEMIYSTSLMWWTCRECGKQITMEEVHRLISGVTPGTEIPAIVVT